MGLSHRRVRIQYNTDYAKCQVIRQKFSATSKTRAPRDRFPWGSLFSNRLLRLVVELVIRPEKVRVVVLSVVGQSEALGVVGLPWIDPNVGRLWRNLSTKP